MKGKKKCVNHGEKSKKKKYGNHSKWKLNFVFTIFFVTVSLSQVYASWQSPLSFNEIMKCSDSVNVATKYVEKRETESYKEKNR